MRVANIKIGSYENFVQTGTVSFPYFNTFPKIIVRVCDKNTKFFMKKLISKMSKLIFNKIFFLLPNMFIVCNSVAFYNSIN